MSEYAAITYEHPNLLVRYPHRRRLAIIASMLGECDTSAWLDYGSGDGEIFNAMDRLGQPFAMATAYEPVPEMLAALERNTGPIMASGRLRSTDAVPSGSFSLVTAFEVLEHLPLPERLSFYRLLKTQTAGARDVLIEVPVEFGPILLVKAVGRMILKGRAAEYSRRQLLRTGFLGKVDDHHGRYDADDTRSFISPHQGFDIRRLRTELEELGEIVAVRRSPFRVLPTSMNQCVIFHLKVTTTN